jgi:hypothetical protein
MSLAFSSSSIPARYSDEPEAVKTPAWPPSLLSFGLELGLAPGDISRAAAAPVPGPDSDLVILMVQLRSYPWPDRKRRDKELLATRNSARGQDNLAATQEYQAKETASQAALLNDGNPMTTSVNGPQSKKLYNLQILGPVR